MNIYVGNLTADTTEEEIRQWFLAFGTVGTISITDDCYIRSGQPRRYGYVDMASQTEGRAAVAGLKNFTVRSRQLTIVEALPIDRPKQTTNAKRFKRVRERSYEVSRSI
jgi:RNA recognition motif-containing protein